MEYPRCGILWAKSFGFWGVRDAQAVSFALIFYDFIFEINLVCVVYNAIGIFVAIR